MSAATATLPGAVVACGAAAVGAIDRIARCFWGAAALGTVAALSYAAPYGYGYGYAPAYVDPYASYASYGYGNGYGYRPVYASSYGYECVTTPQLVWNGWAYRRVWVQTC